MLQLQALPVRLHLLLHRHALHGGRQELLLRDSSTACVFVVDGARVLPVNLGKEGQRALGAGA